MLRSAAIVVAIALGAGLVVAATGGATAQSVALEVVVLNHNDNPVGGAELTATWGDGESATAVTASNGRTFIDVPAGEDVEITIDHHRYVRNHPVEVEDAEQAEVEMDVDIARTPTIVVEDGDGPVEDATVALTDDRPFRTYQTDGDGRIVAERIEQREYTVEVTKPEYYDVETTVDVDGNITETIDIERGSVNVQFNVTDDHFDPLRAVEDATVEVDGDTFSTRSTGLRSIDLPVNQEYDVAISKEGYESENRSLEIDETDRNFSVSIQRTPELNVVSVNEQVVVGESTQITVTNEYDEPVEGGVVSVDGEEVGETNADGEATVEIDESGEHEISVRQGVTVSTTTVEGVEAADEETVEEADEDGEEAESEDADTEADTEADTDALGPGFGVVTALLAVLAVAISRRRQD